MSAPLLEETYLQAKKLTCLSSDRRNAKSQIASLETDCEFVSFCAQHEGCTNVFFPMLFKDEILTCILSMSGIIGATLLK